MPTKVSYEWDFETNDGEGEILDHHHETDISNLQRHLRDGDQGDLVLVCDEDVDNSGGYVQNRYWAYVKDGKLPEQFKDAEGCECRKVPKRFQKQLDSFMKKIWELNC